jgi:hypothetical protein
MTAVMGDVAPQVESNQGTAMDRVKGLRRAGAGQLQSVKGRCTDRIAQPHAYQGGHNMYCEPRTAAGPVFCSDALM